MEKRIISVVVALLMIGAVANAASIWDDGVVGDWSVAANWDTVVPTGTDTANIGNGDVTIDTSSAQCGIVLMGYAAATNGTLRVDSADDGLRVFKSTSSAIFDLSNNATGTGIVIQDAGVVTVGNGSNLGEMRLVNVAGGHGYYYLNGGSLDVQYLNLGAKGRDGKFVGAGGTLVIRNCINKSVWCPLAIPASTWAAPCWPRPEWILLVPSASAPRTTDPARTHRSSTVTTARWRSTSPGPPRTTLLRSRAPTIWTAPRSR